MSVIEIENELKQMSNTERLVVIEIATKLIRSDLPQPGEESVNKKLSMREAAELLRDDYLYNLELTAFTALDGEDFLNV